jgi:nucleoside-diphosphate-sugar epimerase
MVLEKIGLTGATGMLGRHLSAALENAGSEVVSISRSAESGNVSACWDLAEWLELEALDALFAGAQAVVHAGAMVQPTGKVDESRMFNANVRACLNLGQWAIARNIPIIQISGAIVYANTLAPEQKEDSPLGWNGLGGFYGFSKLLAEDVLMRLRQRGLKLGIVRPTSIYGHGISSDKMMRRFLSIAEEGGCIELVQPVDDRVDLVHASDVSRAVVAMLKRECWSIFNIASGSPISIKELAEACVQFTGRGDVSTRGERAAEYKPAVRYSLNTTLAKHKLDWQPEIDIKSGFEMMLRQCVSPRICTELHERNER